MKEFLITCIYSFGMSVVRVFYRLNKNKNTIYVVAPASAGSLGDQALVQGLIEAIASKNRRYRIVEVLITKHQISQLTKKGHLKAVFFPAHSRLSQLVFFLKAIDVKCLFIVGADTLDGTYAPAKNITWINLANVMAGIGVPTSFISFSFSNSPNADVVNGLRSIDSRIRFFSRDNLSRLRFEKFTNRKCELAADLAFLVSSESECKEIIDANNWLASKKESGGRVMGMNVNSLGHESNLPQVADNFGRSISRLLQKHSDLSIIMIPHDFREDQSDVNTLLDIKNAAMKEFHDRIYVLHGPYNSWDAKHLVKNVDFLVTGRMHLGIAALSYGVPVYGFSYNDKFEGLMQHFSIVDNTLQKEKSGNPEELLLFLERASENYKKLIENSADSISNVKKLAINNVHGL